MIFASLWLNGIQYNQRNTIIHLIACHAMTYDTGIDANLIRTFKFDLTDLEANRRGELSPRQRERLREDRGTMLRSFRTGSMGALVLLTSFAGVMLLSNDLEAASPALMLIPLMGITFALSYGMNRWSTRHLLQPQLQSTEGVAQRFTGRTRTGQHYGVRLKPGIGRGSGRGKTFYVTREQHDAFREGQAYRIYYTAGTPPLILAVEKC